MLLHPNAPSVNTLNKAKKKVFKLEFDRFNDEAPFGETEADSKTLDESLDTLRRVIDSASKTIIDMTSILSAGGEGVSDLGIFRSNLSRALTLIKKLNMRGLPQTDVEELEIMADTITTQADQFNTLIPQVLNVRGRKGFEKNKKKKFEFEIDLVYDDLKILSEMLNAKLLDYNASGIKAPRTMEGSGFQLSELRPFSGVEYEYPRRYL